MKLFKLFFFRFLMCVASGCFAQEADTTTVVRIGQSVPDFTVQTLDGKAIRLSALRGKVVLIQFFATWCGPCNVEMEAVEKTLWPKYRNHPDFQWLSIGREHSAEELATFRDEKKLTFPIAPDPERKIYSLFAKMYIPRNFLIDKTGKIVWFEMGFDEGKFQEMMREIDEPLK